VRQNMSTVIGKSQQGRAGLPFMGDVEGLGLYLGPGKGKALH